MSDFRYKVNTRLPKPKIDYGSYISKKLRVWLLTSPLNIPKIDLINSMYVYPLPLFQELGVDRDTEKLIHTQNSPQRNLENRKGISLRMGGKDFFDVIYYEGNDISDALHSNKRIFHETDSELVTLDKLFVSFDKNSDHCRLLSVFTVLPKEFFYEAYCVGKTYLNIVKQEHMESDSCVSFILGKAYSIIVDVWTGEYWYIEDDLRSMKSMSDITEQFNTSDISNVNDIYNLDKSFNNISYFDPSKRFVEPVVKDELMYKMGMGEYYNKEGTDLLSCVIETRLLHLKNLSAFARIRHSAPSIEPFWENAVENKDMITYNTESIKEIARISIGSLDDFEDGKIGNETSCALRHALWQFDLFDKGMSIINDSDSVKEYFKRKIQRA